MYELVRSSPYGLRALRAGLVHATCHLPREQLSIEPMNFAEMMQQVFKALNSAAMAQYLAAACGSLGVLVPQHLKL